MYLNKGAFVITTKTNWLLRDAVEGALDIDDFHSGRKPSHLLLFKKPLSVNR